MVNNASSAFPGLTASVVLGRKLDSIRFSSYHLMIILVLGLVAFVDGYDLAMTGSLIVLAKAPLHMTATQTRLLTVAANFAVVIGGFMAAGLSDHWSRRTLYQSAYRFPKHQRAAVAADGQGVKGDGTRR